MFERIAASFLQDCSPSGKGSPKGLVIEGSKGSHDYGLPLLMRFFIYLTRALTCSLKKGARKAHYTHRQRLQAKEKRFCPLLWWEAGGRGKPRWEAEEAFLSLFIVMVFNLRIMGSVHQFPLSHVPSAFPVLGQMSQWLDHSAKGAEAELLW